MSIRPIDHGVMIPKTQEVANAKQTENLKNKNVIESQFIQQEKTIKKNSKKVLNTEKTVYNKIRDEEKSKQERHSDGNEKNKEKRLIRKDDIKDLNRGKNIDIRI